MKKKVKSAMAAQLISILRENSQDLLDSRKKGNNTQYQVEDALMAAFSVFFTQSPSFLEHQRLMKNQKGKDNAESLFSLKKIPCDNQIRNLLDPVPAKKTFGVFRETYEWLENRQGLNQFEYLGEEILVAMDGSEYFSSDKIHCPHCSKRQHKNGKVTYFHQVITPVIVSPNCKKVINLEPEFVRKQEGKSQQDCEIEAAKRWLLSHPIREGSRKITLLADDLYAHQPTCELALNQGYNFIFVCRESSHKRLYEWLEFLQKSGEVQEKQEVEYEKGKKRIYHYRYVNNIPLRETEPSLMVNWCEMTVTDSSSEKILYQNRFITNHEINESNVSKIAKGGRTRWKVENEGFNTLKKHGYHLEHNFGHGQQNLGEILLSLNLLSFLFHNLLDLVDTTYQKVRSLLGTRRTFFNDLRALLKYFWFANWSDLWEFILTEDDDSLAVNSS